MQYLYFGAECNCCEGGHMNFSLDDQLKKKLMATVKKAYQFLHKKKGYKPEYLAEENPLTDLLKETNNVFQEAIIVERIPQAMLKSLREDVFVFSGLKTHAQLTEASQLLLTAEGKRKSFSQFSKDVEKIQADYNEHYLQAEYLFATGSAQMAGNWANFSDNTTRYYLQYRTAADSHVRDAHAKLHNITLPKDDEFWDKYGAKNGWNCRCNNVEVRAAKYEKSDSAKAVALGEAATSHIDKDGKNKLEIFRFNPGKQKVVFPPAHPYQKLAGAKEAKEAIKHLNAI